MRNTMASHHAESNLRIDRMELKIKRIAMSPAARMRSEPGSTSGRRAHDYNRYSRQTSRIISIQYHATYCTYCTFKHNIPRWRRQRCSGGVGRPTELSCARARFCSWI